ncbi:MAG: hypothetical protein H0W64_02555 [Gammaproteobacteria bacterium]|nr:hypothetical protein [Gammaproteobacteria bacterium]
MAGASKWIKNEAIKVLPAIIYFCIAFNLVHFSVGLLLASYDIRYFSYLEMTIAALVVGKIIVIVEKFPFIDAFPDKPLIYNIFWKTFIYVSAVLIFRIVDNSIRLLLDHRANEIGKILLIKLSSPVFWSTQIGVSIFFVFYIIFTEISNAIGNKKMWRLLFG